MGKRGFWRVSTNLPVDFFWDNYLHEGAVKNLSGSGMYIESDICPPRESDIGVVFIVGDEVFRLTGKVTRTVGANGTSGGIGVELLTPAIDYRKFVCTVQDYEHNGPSVKLRLEVPKRIDVKVAS